MGVTSYGVMNHHPPGCTRPLEVSRYHPKLLMFSPPAAIQSAAGVVAAAPHHLVR